MNNLIKYGFEENLSLYIKENKLENLVIGRIINQQKDRFFVITHNNEIVNAEITGNLRFTAISNKDFPVIGDWVAMISSDDFYVITKVLIRKTLLERKSVSDSSDTQLIASNIDFAFIVQSVDENFNLNRLERYLSIIYAGRITPIIILNKIDLISNAELNDKIKLIESRMPDIKIVATSTLNNVGVYDLREYLIPSKTYCLIGSSGVGKSSLLNVLNKEEVIRTREISNSNFKGRHTTTHKELFIIKKGAILIDTPGMRELGVYDNKSGIEKTFSKILQLSEQCKFINCSHSGEPGCRIQLAIENAEIDLEELINFQKLERESDRFTSSKAEKRKKDKSLGKLYKKMQNHKRKWKNSGF